MQLDWFPASSFWGPHVLLFEAVFHGEYPIVSMLVSKTYTMDASVDKFQGIFKPKWQPMKPQIKGAVVLVPINQTV